MQPPKLVDQAGDGECDGVLLRAGRQPGRGVYPASGLVGILWTGGTKSVRALIVRVGDNNVYMSVSMKASNAVLLGAINIVYTRACQK